MSAVPSLRPLQRALESIYGLPEGTPIDPYVRALPADDPEANRRELVLVHEAPDGEELSLAVCFSPELLGCLEGETVPGLSRFDAWCHVLEGVSHFVLLVQRAMEDRPVSLFELELQAEVDKFAVAWLDRVPFGTGDERRLHAARLREAQFERVRFTDGEQTEKGQRYRRANDVGRRYVAMLERRFIGPGRVEAMVAELRSFYRAEATEKTSVARTRP